MNPPTAAGPAIINDQPHLDHPPSALPPSEPLHAGSMRPPRIIILAAFSLSVLFTICVSLRTPRAGVSGSGSGGSGGGGVHAAVATSSSAEPSSRLSAFFNLRAPFSLFPPNAIISLTHDNTTAFLARPAAFGPLLPRAGLKGPVWIGSGFGDESLRQGVAAAAAEGELGCSDVPGYLDALKATNLKDLGEVKSAKSGKPLPLKLSEKDAYNADSSLTETMQPSVSDGTDDHLHHVSSSAKPADKAKHADIQSLQETAEIAGKVVLLSRGGCGFLEKVKWAQRRGAIALIVGDDQKGGPLIQMYARGDTSNVTIPAIFTSHTTAHLLSSLMESGALVDSILDKTGKSADKSKPKNAKSTSRKPKPNKQKSPTKKKKKPETKATGASNSLDESRIPQDKELPTEKRSWFPWLATSPDESRSSGNRVSASKGKEGHAGRIPIKKASAKPITYTDSEVENQDDFLIGVEDWRDPVLLSKAKGKPKSDTISSVKSLDRDKKADKEPVTAGKRPAPLKDIETSFEGGSIVPSSGEYDVKDVTSKEDQANGWLSKVFGDIENPSADGIQNHKSHQTSKESVDTMEADEDAELEGLWVTLTPTSGASPFLDTLLVLVVSPLVTLTVVYALLLIRSRIRRRRWRAPKSIVQRLPVRTYRTIDSPGSLSPRLPSPTSTSPATPLLTRAISSRPRSRTTTGIPEAEAHVSPVGAMHVHGGIHSKEQEKIASSPGQWRKYMSRQAECVICLEEYVDGVSQILTLPCNHVYHADCITPWLTTRRRTCPICKNDVVRSLAGGSPSSPRFEAYHSDSEDEDGARDLDIDDEETAERGLLSVSPTTPRADADANTSSSSWREVISASLNTLSRFSRTPSAPARDRSQ